MFADAYGKPIGLGVWLAKRLIRPRHGIDLLYQIAALGFVFGLVLLLIVFVLGVDGGASSRSENLFTYLASLMLSFPFFPILLQLRYQPFAFFRRGS
jgi:hypothetical protein